MPSELQNRVPARPAGEARVSGTGARFDVTTGQNLAGPVLWMPPELVQKLPHEDAYDVSENQPDP